MKAKVLSVLGLLATATCLTVSLQANPTGGDVVGGDGNATIAGEGTGVVTVNQYVQNAIINWDDFSIGLGELTQFLQPNASSAVLNRVMSGNPSQLLGTLQGNGQVYLINPNGVFVGPSGQVNVNTFIASTLDISDDQFLAQGTLNFAGDSTAGVENLGSINALGGDIFLFGYTVKNDGTISAPGGVVGLGAGTRVELRQQGNERIGIILADNAAGQGDVGVDNQGLISAASAEIKAAGGNVYAVAINNGGTIRAEPSLQWEGGQLVLKSEGGTVINTGSLIADNANGNGGSIRVEGGQVGMTGNAVVSANGTTGGGTINIGGGFQGADLEIENAMRTYIGSDVTLSADATVDGDGGTIIVWSDEITRYYGSLSATGTGSGDGGFAEVSGKQYLDFDGSADVSSLNGLAGTILLDPENLSIVALGANDGDVSPTGVDFTAGGGADISVSASALEALAGNVEIEALNDITVDAAINFANQVASTVNFVAGGSITLNQNVQTGGGALTFTASSSLGNDVANATIIVNAALGSASTGFITFNNDGSGGIVLNNDVTAAVGSGINFNNSVTLGTDVTLSALSVFLASGETIDGPHNLMITSAASLGGDIGGNDALTSLTIGGLSTIAGNVTTTGAQTYNDSMNLGGDVAFTSTGGGDILFAGTVNSSVSARALAVNTSGNTTFNNDLGGGGIGLASVITDAAGTLTFGMNLDGVTTTGNQTFGEAVAVLTQDTAFTTAGGTVSFGGTLDGTTAGMESATITGNAAFGGEVGGTTALELLTVSGTAAINGNITTAEQQSFGGAVTLGANSVLTSLNDNTITFSDAVDGAFDLTVTTAGDTTFVGNVGVMNQLNSLATDGGGTTFLGADSTSVNISASTHTYTDMVTFAGDLTITGTAATFTGGIAGNGGGNDDLRLDLSNDTTLPGAAINFATIRNFATGGGGNTIIDGDITVTGTQTYDDAVLLNADVVLTGTTVAFNSTLDSMTANRDLSIMGNAVFGSGGSAEVGATLALNNLSISADTTFGSTSGTDVTTIGTQTYSGNVILEENTSLVSGGAFMVGGATDSASGEVNSLDVDANGNTKSFGGSIGATDRLEHLGLAVNAGTTTLNGTEINVNGASDTRLGVLQIAANLTVDQDGSGIVAAGDINGAFALVINNPNETQHNGIVNTTSYLTDAAGSTTLGGDVTTTSFQTFNDTVNLNAGGGTRSFTGVNVTFNGTVEGDGDSMAVLDSGTTTFAGNIGGMGALLALSTDAAGDTTISANIDATTQTYDDDVTISGTAVLTGTTGTFNDTLNGDGGMDDNLTLNFSADTDLNVATLGIANLHSLTTGNGGNTIIDGNITTSGDQTYNDNVIIDGNSILAGVNVSFNGTLNADDTAMDRTLLVNASGTTTFGAEVGGTGELESLTTDAAGGTTIGADITVNGASITFNDAVTLSANSVITENGTGDVTFADTIGGAFDLTVNTPGGGDTIFNGNVNIANLTTDAVGATMIGASSITTSGDQSYGDAITQTTQGVVYTGVNGTFNGLNGGGFDVTLNFSGDTTLNATFMNIDNLMTGNGGTTFIDTAMITTLGNQTYNDAVILNQDTSLSANAGMGNVTFNNTVDSDSGMNRSLGITGNAFFGDGGADAVGGTDALSTLTVTGTSTFNSTAATDVTTTGAQDYQGAVTLSADTSVAGVSIDFDSTIDGGFALDVNDSGTTRFQGLIGNSTALASLTTDGGGVTIFSAGTVDPMVGPPGIHTSGDQTYNNAVVLDGGSFISFSTLAGPGNLTFNSTIDDNASGTALGFSVVGVVTFNDAIGSMDPLTAVIGGSGGGIDINGGSVTTDGVGTQSYFAPVRLGADTVLTSTGPITFDSQFQPATVNGAHNLTINTVDTTTFSAAVGGTTPLASLTTDAGGTTAVNGDSVTTTGGQTYGDAVTVDGDTVFTATDAMSTIDFMSTLAGGVNNLTIDAAEINFGAAVSSTGNLNLFSGAADSVEVGGVADSGANVLDLTAGDLANLMDGFNLITIGVSGGTAPITVTGAASFNDPVTLNSDGAGGAVSVNAQLDTLAGSGQIDINGATINLGGDIFTDGDNINLNSGAGVVMTGNSTIDSENGDDSDAGDVSITATSVSGNAAGRDLTIDTSTAGGTGGDQSLANFEVAAGFFLNDITLTSVGSVANGNISGPAPWNIKVDNFAADLSSITISGNLNLGAGAHVFSADDDNAQAGTVNLQNAIVSANAAGATLEINSFGTAQMGNTTSLGVFNNAAGSFIDFLTVNTGASIAGGTSDGSIDVFNDITTSASQTYNGPVNLMADVNLTGNIITFNGTVDGAQALTITDAGNTSFNDTVGNNAALTSLTTIAGGSTTINGGVVTTTGNQTYNDAVLIGNSTDATLTAGAGAGNVIFNSTVDATTAGDEGVDVMANAQVNDRIGGTTPLEFFNVTGTTLFDVAGSSSAMPTVLTSGGGQNYGMTVTLNQDTVLSDDNMGVIQFGGAITGDVADIRSLTVNTAGNTVFNGANVGNPNQLNNLTTDDPSAPGSHLGGITFLSGTFNTAGNQTFNDDVQLTTDVINNAGGNVSYNGTLNGDGNGPWDLTVNTSMNTVFAGIVGGNNPLDNILTDMGGTTMINTTGVTTVNDQTYNDAVTFGSSSTHSGVNLTFNSTVDAASGMGGMFTVTLNGSGITMFNDVVGGNDPLAGIGTDMAGSTEINGGVIITSHMSGGMTFNDPVTLGADTALTANGSGAQITFNNTLDGDGGTARNLVVNTPDGGTTIFNDVVGGNDPLNTLETDEAGQTQINGGVVTTDTTQTYNDAVQLGANTILNATVVTFNSTLDSDGTFRDLTINAAAVFGDVLGGNDFVGNTSKLNSLIVNGTTLFNTASDASADPGRRSSVLTENGQTYNGEVILGNHTILASDNGGTISFAANINGDGNGVWDLFVNTSGLTQFAGGMVGNSAILGSLVTDDPNAPDMAPSDQRGGTTELTGTFNTVDNQQFFDDVIVKSDVVNNSTMGGEVRYDLTLNGDGAGPWNLNVTTSGTTMFNGVVGGVNPLNNLTTDGAGGMDEETQINGGAITTVEDQTYGDAVTLGANTILDGNDITFNDTLDSRGGNFDLTVNSNDTGTPGITTFNGAVGGIMELRDLITNADGMTIINGGLVASTRDQTYNDAVFIGDPDGTPGADDMDRANSLTTISSSASGQIHFASTIDDDATVGGIAGEAHLAVNTFGVTRFDGLIGSITPLTTLVTDSNVMPNDNLSLTGTTHFNATSPGMLDANNLMDVITMLQNDTIVTTVRTTGNQTYNDSVILQNDAPPGIAGNDVIVRADDPGATISFNSAIDGRDSNNQFMEGLIIFSDNSFVDQNNVGLESGLEFLDISSGPNVMFQTLTLMEDTELRENLIRLGIVETLGHNLTITANEIDFVGGVGSVRGFNPANGPYDPTMPESVSDRSNLTLRPLEHLADPNGGMHREIFVGVPADVAGTFSLSNDDLLALADGFRTITIGRHDGANTVNVIFANFTDPVRIESPQAGGTINIVNLTSSATTQEAALATIIFANDVDNSGMSFEVDGYGLGDGIPQPGADVGVHIFGAGSTTTIGTIGSSGTDIFINDAVLLGFGGGLLNTTQNGMTTGGDITITGTLNSSTDQVLTLNGGSGGDLDFQSAIGNTSGLSVLTIQQANNVEFDSTVNLDVNPGNLTVNANGNITFAGAVTANGVVNIQNAVDVLIDSTVMAGALVQDAGTGTTTIEGNVTTTGAQGVNITSSAIVLGDAGNVTGVTVATGGNLARFNGAVSLVGGDIAVTTGAGNITFESTIDGGQNLDLNSTGNVTLQGAVGSTTELTSLDTDAGGTTFINGGGVATTGTQTYGDAVVVGVNDATFSSTGAGAMGDINFTMALDGNRAVTVNTAGTTTFGGVVGGNDPLTSLITDAAGTVVINGGAVTTDTFQTYIDGVTVGADTVFNGIDVTFGSTLDGPFNVNVNDSGMTTFVDLVGNTTALTSLTTDIAGVTAINTTSVMTTGAQAYNDDVTLGADVVLDSTGGAQVLFGQTVNGPQSLTINTTGETRFNGAVGGGTQLTSLTTDAGGTTAIAGGSVSAATQTYNDSVIIEADTGLIGMVILNDDLDGLVAGAQNLTVTGSLTVGDAGDDTIGGTTALSSVTVNGATTFNSTGATVVTTTGGQTYSGATTLMLDTTVASTGGGDIDFQSTVDGTTADTESLSVNTQGNGIFGGVVGGTTSLASITTDAGGTTTFNSGASAITALTQTYNDAVILDTTAESVTINAGTSVTFNSTVDSAGNEVNSLIINSPMTTFNGQVGNMAGGALATLMTDAAGTTTINTDVVTGDILQFDDSVVIGAAASTLTGTSSVTFNGTVDGAAAGANSLTVNSPSTTFNGVVGATALNSLTTDAAGTTAINGGAVTTTAAQTYNDNVTIGMDTTLMAGGDILFGGTLDGAFNLILNSPMTVTFSGVVGGNAALTSILTDAVGTMVINGGAVTTTGTQTYNDDVILGADTTLTASTVAFNDDVDAAAAGVQGLAIVGNLVVGNGPDDTIGGVAALEFLTVSGTTAFNSAQTVTDSVTTTGLQTYTGAVTLGADTSLTSTGSGAVSFLDTIDGAQALTVNTGGATSFGGVIGGTTGLTSLTTDAGGTTTFTSAGTSVTAATQTYGDAVVIDVATLTLNGGASVTFNSTVDSAAMANNNLIVNSPTTIFNGNVGQAASLGTLMTDAAGTTTLNAPLVTAAIVDFDDAILIDQDTTITGTTSVDFASTVDSTGGENNALTVVSPTTAFNGAVGSNDALSSLTTDNDGTTTINAGTITTTGAQTYNDAITLGSNTLLTSTGSGNITFGSTLDGTFDLTVNTGGITSFNGVVGGIAGLNSLTTDAAGTSVIDAMAVTAATVTINDPLTIAQNTLITASTSATFNNTVDGVVSEMNDLLINSPSTTFNGRVGSNFALGTLQTDAAGTTTISTDIVTADVVDFNDAVVLESTTTVTGTTSVTFDGTVNSAANENNNLTVNSPLTAFNAQVGNAAGNTVLGTLTTDAAGTTTINTDVINGAILDFNDAIVIETDTTLTGTTSVDFAQTVDSAATEANDLTVNSPVTTFNGRVGAADDDTFLGAITTDAAGTTTINTDIVNSVTQLYNDSVVIAVDSTLTATTSAIFNSTLNSETGEANDLTINSPTTVFNGNVGGAVGGAFGALTTDAAGITTINAAIVNAAVIDFNDIIIIDTDTTITGTTSVDFAQTIDSASGENNDLTVNSPITGFHGQVGGTDELEDLITDAAGTTTIDTDLIDATQTITFNDAVIIAVDTTVDGDTSVTFNGTVDSEAPGAPEGNDLTVNSALTAFNGRVGASGPDTALGTLTTDLTGGLNRTEIDTDMVIADVLDFNDTVRIDQDTTLTGTTSVDFALTVDSEMGDFNDLFIVSPMTTFNGNVGTAAGGAIGELDTDAAGTTFINTAIVTGAVLDFNDAIIIDNAGGVTLNGSTSVDFASTVDSGAMEINDLTINSPSTTFNGIVGGNDIIGNLITDNQGGADTTVINTTAISADTQTYNDMVDVDTDTTLTGTTFVTFNNTLDSTPGENNSVTVLSPLTTFNGVVGGNDPLSALLTDRQSAADLTMINGGLVITTGPQTYLDNVTLGMDTLLRTGTTATFGGTVNGSTVFGGESLTITGLAATPMIGGNAVFGDSPGDFVGDTLPLEFLLVTGTTTFNAGIAGGDTVRTSSQAGGSGAQTYVGAVTLGADTTLTSIGVPTAAGAAGGINGITFGATVDGGFNLLVNSSGVTTFTGVVGGITPLASVTTDGTMGPGEITIINGGAVTTVNDQTYNDNVGLGIDTVLTATAPTSNIFIGATPANTLMGIPVGADVMIDLVANAGTCVIIRAAISSLNTLNGVAGVCFVAANPNNTGINMVGSQPLAPLVFVFSSPPAQYRVGPFLIDMGALFAQDADNLFRYPGVTYPSISIGYEAMLNETNSSRSGVLSTDIVVSTFDLLDDSNEGESDDQ